jgi:hypothetical protein
MQKYFKDIFFIYVEACPFPSKHPICMKEVHERKENEGALVCRHEIMNKADKGESGQREGQTMLDSRIRRNFRCSLDMMANCGGKQPDRHIVKTY